MTASDEAQLERGLDELTRFERGHASFAIDADGAIIYSGTVATVKMQPDEPMAGFVERLRRDHGLRPGDVLEILNNGGRLDTARIYRQA